MQTFNSSRSSRIFQERDPVAILIEEELCKFARREGAIISVREDKDGKAEARFDAATAGGENRDIAILRLANSLLEDPRFRSRLTRALSSVRGLSLDQNSPVERATISAGFSR
jgi:hypothetical protein